MYTILILPIICISSYAFIGPVNNQQHKITSTSHDIHQLYIATRDDQDASSTQIEQPISLVEDAASLDNESSDIKLQAYISSGIECKSDLSIILQTIKSTCEEEYGLPIDVTNVQCNEQPAIVDSIPGALGRVLVINVCGMPIDENELIIQLKNDLSERIDGVLQSDDVSNQQPILLAFQSSNTINNKCATGTIEDSAAIISDIIEKEISDYNLLEEVNEICNIYEDVDLDSLLKSRSGCFVHPYEIEINCYPSMVIDIDGDMVVSSSMPNGQEDDDAQDVHFDTSSVLIFDKLLDKKLRKRLLNVVKGYPEDHTSEKDDWDDDVNGPDSNRWKRGGLLDVLNDNSDSNEEEDEGSCWGLSEDAIMDICYNEHPAIAEFESKLSLLFPDFIVSRLPEAVFGECVISPLTANAPTHGDTFDYHIDADPLQTPASAYTDVFGRYPNRMKGKPRFISCLVYLNDEWNGEEWGAPTRFLDPPTNESLDILPKPGRVVIMDQDISHTVVAPNVEAGKRPRYSLVWKLILHPREAGQDMGLCCGRGSMWPEPIAIGSAKRD